MRQLTLIALLLAGCAHRNDAVDPNFYDVQWGKTGATRESWNRDAHECDVEEHQRSTYDNIEYQNRREREWEYNRTMQRNGSPYYYSSAASDKDEIESRRYWDECMFGRSWEIVGQKPIGTEDQGIESNTRSFKP